MKSAKLVSLSLIAISLGVATTMNTTTAHALKSHWKASHWVTLKKPIKIMKVKSANGHHIKTYHVAAGHRLKLSHWDVNYNWAFQSGKYHTNGRYTYTTNKAYNDASWFRMDH